MKGLSTEFQYLLDSRWLFLPKSKQAALTGIEGGFLPEAALVFRGVNVRPIFEEPYDLMELDRVLAKPQLSLETVQLLMKVFGVMTRNPDKEVALFAAGSINTLEVRCVKEVQGIKKAFAESKDPADARRLFVSQFEMSVVNETRPVLRFFYLKEALETLAHLWSLVGPDPVDLDMAVQAHLDLRQPREAEELIQRFLVRTPGEHHLYYLMARVKFFRGDYPQVMALLAFLNSGQLIPEAGAIHRFWMGEGAHG